MRSRLGQLKAGRLLPVLLLVAIGFGAATILSREPATAQACAGADLGTLPLGYTRFFDGEIEHQTDCRSSEIGLATGYTAIDVYDLTLNSGVATTLRVSLASTAIPHILLYSATGSLVRETASASAVGEASEVVLEIPVRASAQYHLVVTTGFTGHYSLRIDHELPEEIKQDIAERYAPWLLFHNGDGGSDAEQFFPVSILAMIHHAWLFEYSDDDPNCPSFDPQYDCDDPLLLSRATPHLHSGLSVDTYLDIRTDGPSGMELDHEDWWRTVGGRYKEPVVYARVTIPEGGGISVQYWFFYVFNDAPGDPTNYWDHEGDWESIQLVFDQPWEDVHAGTPPDEIGYAAHDGGHVGTASCVTWQGNHPMVYVARGSHASHFEAGTHPTAVSSEHADGRGLVLRPWHPPLSVSSSYRLEMIEENLGVWQWRGQWGDRLGGQKDGPIGPLHQSHSWLRPSELVAEEGWRPLFCGAVESLRSVGVAYVWGGDAPIHASALVRHIVGINGVTRYSLRDLAWERYGLSGGREIPGSVDFEIQPGNTLLWLTN